MRRRTYSLSTLGKALFNIAWFNFMAFWIIAFAIGGDALRGKVVNGHYFLANHGRLTEVSPWVWHYSRVHTISIFITHPIGIFVGGGLISRAKRRGDG